MTNVKVGYGWGKLAGGAGGGSMTMAGRALGRVWAALSIAKLAIDRAPRLGALAASLAALLAVTFIGSPAQALPPPVLSKSFGAASIPVGSTTSMSFTVTNNLALPLTGIGFTDSFPAGLAVSTPNGLSTSCGGTVTAVAGSSSLSLSGATLTAASSCTIQVNVTPSVAATMTNTTGPITSNESGPGGTATATLTVTPLPAPGLTKSFGASSIPVGGTTSMSFTVANTNASSSLTGIAFSDTFPAGLAVSTPNGLFNSCGGTLTAVAGSSSLSLSGAALPASASCSIQINVTPSTVSAMTNVTGQITSNESGPGGTATASLTVTQATTTTTVNSSANPSVFGQPVTFTATVTPVPAGSIKPTGTVTLSIDGNPVAIVPVNASGQVTFTTSALSVASHAITATYNGDPNFVTSIGSLTQVVNQASTTTTLTPSVNPSTLGQPVTFTATVSGTGGTPTGSVTFVVDGTPASTMTLVAGVANFTTSSLPLGPHTIVANYSGDTIFLASSASITQNVNPGVTPSTTTLTTSNNPSLSGQPVTFTANVSGAGGPPTGTVTFKDGATTLATVTLAGGTASFTTSSLAVGNHTITANYSGDPTFNASSASLTQNVFAGAQPTTTALASNPNPSVHNQPVTFTATVTSGSGTPTGTVTFLDAGQAIGTGTLAAGVATFTTASLTIGTHSITASYAGANAFLASTSPALSQAVNVPLDSLKLRAMQVQATQIAAQISGDAFSEAVAAAITDGFSDEPAFATPSANGIHVNMSGQLAAGQQLSDSADAQTPDPALGRAAVLSDLGTKPAPSTFASLTSSSNAGRDQPAAAGPTKPGASNPNQVASLDPKQTAAAPQLVGPSPTAWQAWADVRGSGWDNSGQAGDIHGTQVNTLVGLTRRLAPDFLVGALAGYEHFDYSSQLLNGRLTGDGWTVGGYLGWRLDPQLRFDAAVAHSGVNYNGVAGTASGSFPGSRWIASAGLTGTYQLMPFEIEPSAKVFALWEHEDPYTDSLGTPQAAFHFTTGRGSGGLKVAYPTALSDGTIVKPYVGFYGDYYFSSNNANTVLVPSTFIRGGAGRVTAGITARLDSGIRLALGGEYGGIGNNFQNWTVMGRLSVPLSTLFGLPSPMAAKAMPVKAAAATPAKQVASLQPVTDAAIAPVASAPDAPAVPPERIVVRFSEHALFLTAEGRKAFDRAIAELLDGKPVQVTIEGCDAGADVTDGSLCTRRQASLQQLLEANGVASASQVLAGP